MYFDNKLTEAIMYVLCELLLYLFLRFSLINLNLISNCYEFSPDKKYSLAYRK